MPEPDPDQHDDFDEAMSRELGRLAPGRGLRDAIVQRYQHGRRLQFAGMIAGCAVVVLLVLFIAGSLSWTASRPPVLASAWMKDAVQFIDDGFPLAAMNPDPEVMQEFYQTVAPDADLQLPGLFARMPPVGCRTVELDGVQALLACYYLGSGEQMHLFVIGDPSQLRGVHADQPDFQPYGQWITAAWRRHGTIYVAVSSGEPAKMRELLVRYGKRLIFHWV